MSDHSMFESTFADRHIGLDNQAIATMLAVIGVDSLDDLAAKAVPTRIFDTPTDSGLAPGLDQLPPAASEAEALAELRALADTNTTAVSMIGQGYYDTFTPQVLLRNIMENPAWYTAYTPYQPRSARGGSRRCSTFRRWSPISPASRSRMLRCSTRAPRRRKP